MSGDNAEHQENPYPRRGAKGHEGKQITFPLSLFLTTETTPLFHRDTQDKQDITNRQNVMNRCKVERKGEEKMGEFTR